MLKIGGKSGNEEKTLLLNRISCFWGMVNGEDLKSRVRNVLFNAIDPFKMKFFFTVIEVVGIAPTIESASTWDKAIRNQMDKKAKTWTYVKFYSFYGYVWFLESIEKIKEKMSRKFIFSYLVVLWKISKKIKHS